ncbi:MAG: GreA/GreB family elongation factor [Alphaproteobacteria bacterium]
MTARDFARLERLAHLEGEASGETGEGLALLRAELARAIVCSNDEPPRDVVRLGSTVLLRHADEQGETQKMRAALVYPGEPHESLPSIPVSTPLGAALLGLRAGDVMAYDAGGVGAADVSRHVVRVMSVRDRMPLVWPPDTPPPGAA